MDSSGSGWGPDVGCCEHGNKLSSSIKCSKFLDQLSNYHLLKKKTLLCGSGLVYKYGSLSFRFEMIGRKWVPRKTGSPWKI